jgi:hypoxanthine phosphoribosyltransferase
MEDTKEDFEEVLSQAKLIYDDTQISDALDRMSNDLNSRLKNLNPLVLCVMQGGIVFTGHLVTRLTVNLELDYIHATRYRNKTSGDELNWLVYPRASLKDRTVLILDDILDEGITLHAIIEYCHQQGASEVISAVLLRKHHDRCKEDVKADYTALEVNDHYVFGFGMDYKGQHRHLNGIYAAKDS